MNPTIKKNRYQNPNPDPNPFTKKCIAFTFLYFEFPLC